MSLRECMEKHTERELRVWLAHIEEEEARTTPDQYFMAQIAAEVRRVLHPRPQEVRLEHCVLKFRRPATPEQAVTPGLTAEGACQMMKAAWGLQAGLPPGAMKG